MSPKSSGIRQVIRKEVALLAGLLFLGLVIMPIGIFWIGQTMFGTYGGHGYGEFFGTISEKIRAGDAVAWFLALAPYLAWQCLRLMLKAWRLLSSPAD